MGNELLKKSYTGQLTLKEAGQAGEFEAVFATMNVIDHDGDVTLPGAFGRQATIIEPWNHNYNAPPVGMGTIGERDNDAVVDGKFFLNTLSGAEHYEVVKALRDTQEWSYSFYITEAEFGKFEGRDVRFLKKMDVIGVGPVTRGAGIGTRVTDIKGKRPDAIPRSGGDTDNTESDSDEGETGDGKPSGTGADVIRTELDLIELED